MKSKLIILLFSSLVLLIISVLLTNIYLLGIAELIVMPTIVMLIKNNFKYNKSK